MQASSSNTSISVYGGGWFHSGSSSLTTNATIIAGNKAEARGRVGSPTSTAQGGGLYLQAGLPSWLGSGLLVANNLARTSLGAVRGGGVSADAVASVLLLSSVVRGNAVHASHHASGAYGGAVSLLVTPGGAVVLRGLSLRNNSIRANGSRLDTAAGGGLYSAYGCRLAMTRVSVSGNTVSVATNLTDGVAKAYGGG